LVKIWKNDDYFENSFASKKMALSNGEKFGAIGIRKITGKAYIAEQ
jgi:hypothetical protein